MEFTYESQGTSSFLVYTTAPEEELDTLTLGMITNNKIPSLATAMYTQVNDKGFVKYNISSKVEAEQIFSGTVSRKQLLGVFYGIAEALNYAEEYMIPQENIVLDLKYIYVDVSTYNASLICIPVKNYTNKDSLNLFLKKIVFNTRFDERENSEYVTRIINFLNMSENVSTVEFKELITSLKNEPAMSQDLSQTFFAQQEIPNNFNPNMQAGFTGQMHRAPEVQQPNFQNPMNMIAQQNEFQAPVFQQQVPQEPVVPTAIPQQPEKPSKKIAKNHKQQKEVQPHNMAQNNNSAAVPQIKKTAQGFAIPGKENVQSANAAMTESAATEEKISLGYLLMHYSSENVAKYKAQKGSTEHSANQLSKAEKKEQAKAAKQAKKNHGAASPMVNVPGQPNVQQPGMSGQMNVQPQRGMTGQPNMQQPGMSGQIGMQQQGGMTGQSNMQQPGMSGQMNIQPQMRAAVTPQVIVPQQPQSIQIQPQQIQPQPVMQPGMTGTMAQGRQNFGETTVLNAGGGGGETTVLSPSMLTNSAPYLVRKRNNERIDINKPLFRIGKEKSYVDYFIGDNSAISRSHANIITRDGKYYIVDTNSTNHTFIEGQMIAPNNEVELVSGKMIKLANEEFEFHV